MSFCAGNIMLFIPPHSKPHFSPSSCLPTPLSLFHFIVFVLSFPSTTPDKMWFGFLFCLGLIFGKSKAFLKIISQNQIYLPL